MWRIPVIGGKELDLHLLYAEVTQRGGLEKVLLEARLRFLVISEEGSPDGIVYSAGHGGQAMEGGHRGV